MGGLQLNHTRCNDSPAVRATALAASTPTAGAPSAMTSTSSGEPGVARGKGGELRVSARDHPGRPGTRFRKIVFEAARKSLLHMTIQESNPLVTHGDSSRHAPQIALPHRGFGAPIMRGVLRSGGGGPAEQSGASPPLHYYLLVVVSVLKLRVISRGSHQRRCRLSHVMSSSICLMLVSFFAGAPRPTLRRPRLCSRNGKAAQPFRHCDDARGRGPNSVDFGETIVLQQFPRHSHGNHGPTA